MRKSKEVLTQKDMSTVREADVAKIQRDKCFGDLRDYSLQHAVTMRWDLNEEAKRDQIFELVIDGEITVLLDAEQLLRYLRWV
jgi:hypothetical protein